MKKDYETEAIRLAKAVDIAIASFTKYPPRDFTPENLEHVLKVYSGWKHSILNPEPKFRKIASLKYDIENVFTFFQEGTGEAVEHFWRQIRKENLGYVREDKLRKILDRGRIKGRIEYELVTDVLVAAEQEGRITKQEAQRLSEMLGEYEAGKKKKN